MEPLHFAGVELYFEDLPRAVKFYRLVLGLEISDQAEGYYARFVSGSGFVCLERKGSESYPSRDKAVLFFEVANLDEALKAIGPERLVQSNQTEGSRPAWAVLHDPEGHNVLLLEKEKRKEPQ